MHHRPITVCSYPGRIRVLWVLALVAILGAFAIPSRASEERMTAVVRAVQAARPAVVNIQGQKTVMGSPSTTGQPGASQEVSGMGTGIVIDPRGYILTNHHVVDRVRRIEITFDSGRRSVAQLVANDHETDLAIIKVSTSQPLETITWGTSSDLMVGEPVIAIGNAFGYQHTVTRGIVSWLHRDVEVSDTQSYKNLIQTDASINPGNSGGPLLNADGEMIGVNVAVRAGAQGIGFAIPADEALAVAARLLSVERMENRWHGAVTRAADIHNKSIQIDRVEASSPAQRSGLQPGDRIVAVAALPVQNALDFERALLGQRSGEPVSVEVERGGARSLLSLVLEDRPVPSLASRASASPSALPAVTRAADQDAAWNLLGVILTEEPRRTFLTQNSRYRGGMRVQTVRSDSLAAEKGILPGDILVGMHRWETATQQDVDYIVQQANLDQLGPFRFYVLRGNKTFWGEMTVAGRTAAPRR